MEHRMSLRIPSHQPATVKTQVGRALAGELHDLSFDGAFLATKGKHPEGLLQRQVRVLVGGDAKVGTAPLEIPAHVVRAREEGVGLAFDPYDETVNAYLERVYSERFRPAPASFSLWS
ncbi:MAG: PilZ domain-containing protein [Gammaproteobacteria bacterium]